MRVLSDLVGEMSVGKWLKCPRFWILPQDHWMALTAMVLVLPLLLSCQPRSASNSARETLDAEVDMLPLPQSSQILARNDRTGGGQIPECAGVVTELLLGNSMPPQDVYEFYREELLSRGWRTRSEDTHGIVLFKDERTGIEISDSYYSSAVASHNQIRNWEQQFQSLTYISVGRSFYDPAECEEALERIGK